MVARVSMSKALRGFQNTLLAAGYRPDLIEDESLPDYVGGMTGYSQEPRIARNACVTAVDINEQRAEAITTATKPQHIEAISTTTGAPIVVLICEDIIELWQFTSNGARKLSVMLVEESLTPPDLVRDQLDPRFIHRAKTYGRFDGTYQLEFVDIGLLPRVEKLQGADLQRLLERIVAALRLVREDLTDAQRHQILTIAFWLLAAKILHDHRVLSFIDLDPKKGINVLNAVAQHYGGAVPLLAHAPAWRERINSACNIAWSYGNLRRIGPEAISYIYENSLVAKQIRKDLGTHSTPPYLVEYVVGRLQKAIQNIPPEHRVIVEPACGHGAFLVSALRALAEDLPIDIDRHEYLRSRLRGIEIDDAARELARLSLTLADVPNPDGWELRTGDMFMDGRLEALATGGTILLSNPPFENFSQKEKDALNAAKSAPVRANKASEMLRRALPCLSKGAVLGVIVPRSFLQSHQDRETRALLVQRFHVLEVCIFPDNVFTFSDQECAAILAVEAENGSAGRSILMRRVREKDISRFRESSVVSDEEVISGTSVVNDPEHSLFVPELRRLWMARRWRKLEDIAIVGQGLSYHGSAGGSAKTRSDKEFLGSGLGISNVHDCSKLPVTGAPKYVHMDLNPDHIMRWRSGKPIGSPQLLVNHSPRSRGPWCLSAYIDPRGAAVPSTWHTVRPSVTCDYAIEVLWAILNSPFANAYIYAHSSKRDIYSSTLGTLPLPYMTTDAQTIVVEQVKTLFKLSMLSSNYEKCTNLLSEIDSIIMAAYGLFAPSEQRIFSLLSTDKRLGFPFEPPPLPMDSRLPLYLERGLGASVFPLENVLPSVLQIYDVDSEINDGRTEIAALRRIPANNRTNAVNARLSFVTAAIRSLQRLAADTWVMQIDSSTETPSRHG